jgi:hypothetical protein
MGSFACSTNENCLPGFSFVYDECQDDNECESFDDNCDPDLSTCENIPGSFECKCVDGYEFDEAGVCTGTEKICRNY